MVHIDCPLLLMVPYFKMSFLVLSAPYHKYVVGCFIYDCYRRKQISEAKYKHYKFESTALKFFQNIQCDKSDLKTLV